MNKIETLENEMNSREKNQGEKLEHFMSQAFLKGDEMEQKDARIKELQSNIESQLEANSSLRLEIRKMSSAAEHHKFQVERATLSNQSKTE